MAERKAIAGSSECVVDAVDSTIVVWHVNVGDDLGMSRMAGAWVLDINDAETIGTLVATRRALLTPEGENALIDAGVTVRERIDPVATVGRIAAECDELRVVYEKHPNTRTLVAPTWPSVPHPDVLNAHPATSAAPTERALTLARWLEQVAECWDRIERERLIRKYMPGGPNRRPTPVVTRPALD